MSKSRRCNLKSENAWYCILPGKESIAVLGNPFASMARFPVRASPGLFIGELQFSSGLLIVHPGLGTTILCMVGHGYGAPGA